ncbi:DMT family transporter [Thalassospira sp.]|uniref:DMT family transporter n=1 Tax=Thalassospira sp. TaxID=1912094 RepID=UPI003AA982AD
MNEKTRGTIEMAIAMMILGTIGWFVIVSGQSAINVVFWRCAFGAVALVIICAAFGLLRGHLTWRTLLWSALGGGAIVTNWLLLFASFKMASISISTALYNTQPFILLGLGALFAGEKITANKLLWLGVAFGGLLLIIAGNSNGKDTGITQFSGVFMALAAAFFWAVATIITKKLKGTPPHLIALIQVCVGLLMLAPFASFDNLPATAFSWLALITIGVVHTGLIYVLMYSAVQKLPTHLQGSLTFLYPVVAILVDVIAFDHRLSPGQIAGAAAILLGAAGMNLGWRIFTDKAVCPKELI